MVSVVATTLLFCAIALAIFVRGPHDRAGGGGNEAAVSAKSQSGFGRGDDHATDVASATPSTDPAANGEDRASNDLPQLGGDHPNEEHTPPANGEAPQPTALPATVPTDSHSTLDHQVLPEPSFTRPRYQLMSPGSHGPRGRGPGKPHHPSPPGQFFGLKAEGRRIAFVVDKSGSMAYRRFEMATRELVNAVNGLEKGQQFQVILFDQVSVPMPGAPMKPVSPDSRRRLENWLAHITPDGGTDPTAALEDAMRGTPDCIFLLSDGEFPESVRALIASLAPESLIVHTISLENDSAMMMQIAEDHRGVYRYVP